MKTSTTRILEIYSTWKTEGSAGIDNQPTLNKITSIELLDFREFFRDPPKEYSELEFRMVEITVNNEIVRRAELDLIDDAPEERKLDILLTQRINYVKD